MKKIKLNLRIIPIKKKTIQTNLRMAMIAILGIIVIISSYSAYATYQQPTTTEENIPIIEYSQVGTFNYIAYLKNNTVYNTSILYPGQENIFKKITDYINASLTYRFFCDQPADIDGTYELIAQIQTDIWEKEYVIIPQSAFSSTNSEQAGFNADFSINHTSFEDIVYQINDETGVNAQDTTLIMKFDIDIIAETTSGVVSESFTPSLNLSLGKSIIEITENLTQYESGALEETEQTIQPGSIEQSIYWGLTSIAFLVVIAVFLMFTKSDKAALSKTEKQVKKIKKKYGEWIVEVEQLPEMKKTGAVSVKTMDDLVKISEELGKPIIHYNPENPNDERHIFYVLDDPTVYEYILHSKKDQSDMECPICKAKITIESPSDEDVKITCPECGNKILVSMEKSEEKSFVKSLISILTRTKSE